MRNRQNVSSSLSARVIAYLRGRGYTQADMARLLHVSEGFISLVNSSERGLTLDHLETLADALNIPLGALLLNVTRPVKSGGPAAELFEISERLMKKADSARLAIQEHLRELGRTPSKKAG